MIVEPAYRKLGWHASDTHGLTLDGCRVPADHLLGQPGRGSATSWRSSTTAASPSPRSPSAAPRPASTTALDYAKDAQRLRRPDRAVPGRRVRRSPTWPSPSRTPALPHLQGGVAEGAGPPVRPGRGDGQAVRHRGGGRRRPHRHAGVRRLRVHGGVAGGPHLPRRQDPRDRRGHQRDPAPGHRPLPSASPSRRTDDGAARLGGASTQTRPSAAPTTGWASSSRWSKPDSHGSHPLRSGHASWANR